MERSAEKVERHELAGEPLVRERRPEPCVLVIFGITGDLSKEKLLPGLSKLHESGSLPEGLVIAGVSRRASSLKADTPFPIEAIDLDLRQADAFANLREQLESLEAKHDTKGNRLLYLALPPNVVPDTLKNLGQAGIIEKGARRPWHRVIIEKPVGHDLASAKEVNRIALHVLDESQIYRIDHYLGKETVQNLLVFRFGNSIYEPVWNHQYIDHVQITVAESSGIEDRGAFYDATGAVRDMLQNHMLQILCHVAMESPISFGADDIRDKKIELLRSLRPHDGRAVFGQYEGYRDVDGVEGDSKTPTFVATKVFVDNWRWKGVPFYLRTGKALSRRVTEVSVHFDPIPHCLFGTEEVCQRVEPNVLTIGIQPEQHISLRFIAKVPGDDLSVGSVKMGFDYANGGFDQPIAEAYERLLLDSLRGDATLFMRKDAVEASWRFVEPLLETPDDLEIYPVGSSGPEAAARFIQQDGRLWRSL
ncbi:MAG: glucose-6-phosphate dehydrogenase [Planctomycetota bacterium]